MDKVSGRLTVFFQEPFWVGVFQREEAGRLSACKVTFGAEPREQEVYELILRDYYALRYSPEVEAAAEKTVRNPKRLQREARRQTQAAGVGTRSQQALQLQREQLKTQRKDLSRRRREEEKERRFAQRQQKKKEKHKGR